QNSTEARQLAAQILAWQIQGATPGRIADSLTAWGSVSMGGQPWTRDTVQNTVRGWTYGTKHRQRALLLAYGFTTAARQHAARRRGGLAGAGGGVLLQIGGKVHLRSTTGVLLGWRRVGRAWPSGSSGVVGLTLGHAQRDLRGEPHEDGELVATVEDRVHHRRGDEGSVVRGVGVDQRLVEAHKPDR